MAHPFKLEMRVRLISHRCFSFGLTSPVRSPSTTFFLSLYSFCASSNSSCCLSKIYYKRSSYAKSEQNWRGSFMQKIINSTSFKFLYFSSTTKAFFSISLNSVALFSFSSRQDAFSLVASSIPFFNLCIVLLLVVIFTFPLFISLLFASMSWLYRRYSECKEKRRTH